jgi:hypothetical protein
MEWGHGKGHFNAATLEPQAIATYCHPLPGRVAMAGNGWQFVAIWGNFWQFLAENGLSC